MITIFAANVRTTARLLMLVALSAPLLLATGCGQSDGGGSVVTEIELPTDDTKPFKLRCNNVGLYQNTCVLDDPNNPYARSAITEDNKFDIDDEAPSATAKFYLWATALAVGAGAPGENQFYVALNLQRMWASSNSDQTRQQALRAYQSYLDHYFDSVTYFEIPSDSGEYYAFSLNEFTGEMLFDPADLTNTYTSARLFSPDPVVNRAMANQAVADWGYYYDQDLEIFTKNF